jgi:hypothetical protein
VYRALCGRRVHSESSDTTIGGRMEQKAMSEVDIKIHKILDLCLRLEEVGIDAFFDYSPHVQKVEVRTSKTKWTKSCSMNSSLVYVDSYDSKERLDCLINDLHVILIEHSTLPLDGTQEDTK